MFGNLKNKITGKQPDERTAELSHADADEGVVEIVYTSEEDAEARRILQATNNAHGEVEAYYMGVAQKRKEVNNALKASQQKVADEVAKQKVAEPENPATEPPIKESFDEDLSTPEVQMGSPESGMMVKMHQFLAKDVKAKYTDEGLELTRKDYSDAGKYPKGRDVTEVFPVVYKLSEPLAALIEDKVKTSSKGKGGLADKIVVPAIVSLAAIYVIMMFFSSAFGLVKAAPYNIAVGNINQATKDIATLKTQLNADEVTINTLNSRLTQDDNILQQLQSK